MLNRLLLVLVVVISHAALAADPIVHARLDSERDDIELAQDHSYTRIVSRDMTLFTARALRSLDRTSWTFSPGKQTVELVEAWVDQPDGTRVPVAPSSVFTRPSAASQSAPGFVETLTTTVLFPQLVPGSRTHVVWRVVQTTPDLLGFNVMNINEFDWDTVRDETRIRLPADMPFQWGARGGFVVEDRTENGTRHIVARIENTKARSAEPGMPSMTDFMPVFVGSTLTDLAQIGAILHRASAGRAEPTPEIAALAARIVGERTGLDAARALHAWVTANIRYVAVYLSPDDGYVPHAAAEVLKAGYGDCKDYVVLMQALLAARGIEAEMAVLNWGNRYEDLPAPSAWFANHAVLYLPAWNQYVNPTDRYAPFDALDRSLSGKRVVRATPAGVVDRTPPATPAANRYAYSAQLRLRPDGTLVGRATFDLSPNTETTVRRGLAEAASPADLAQRILVQSPEGGHGTFRSSDPRDLLTPLQLSASWQSPQAVNPQGRDITMRVPDGPSLYNPADQRPRLSRGTPRTLPVLGDVVDQTWQTSIALPAGLAAVRLPSDVDVQTEAGRYRAEYRHEPGAVTVTRHLVIDQQVIPAEAYAALEKLLYAPVVDARSIITLAPVTD